MPPAAFAGYAMPAAIADIDDTWLIAPAIACHANIGHWSLHCQLMGCHWYWLFQLGCSPAYWYAIIGLRQLANSHSTYWYAFISSLMITPPLPLIRYAGHWLASCRYIIASHYDTAIAGCFSGCRLFASRWWCRWCYDAAGWPLFIGWGQASRCHIDSRADIFSREYCRQSARPGWPAG